ncbi:hypothetical protein BRC65_02085 [Halobacteriales archaeon QH_2_65_14]|nr:MAG: hypothetical protein BRC65_02085 [Halobacteriales archaeon QH_2_65_14]
MEFGDVVVLVAVQNLGDGNRRPLAEEGGDVSFHPRTAGLAGVELTDGAATVDGHLPYLVWRYVVHPVEDAVAIERCIESVS